jgi:hypothetical protein
MYGGGSKKDIRSTALLLYMVHVCFHASSGLSASASVSYELSSHATTVRFANE